MVLQQRARVVATDRVGDVVRHDPDDALLTYKLRFPDGKCPQADWFCAAAVELLGEEAAERVGDWGVCKLDGKRVKLLTLRDATGSTALVSNYGATLVALNVPDCDGQFDDVLLGFDDLCSYEEHTTYIGCAVGRVCSRIGGATFKIGEDAFQLPQNNGTACHHGGPVGFNRYTWKVVNKADSSVTMRLESPDGDMGFPGNLSVLVTYALLPADDGTALSVRFQAETDKATIVNLTNHAYFNLAGHVGNSDFPSTMLDHEVTINADQFVPTDEGSVPLPELRSVKGTPLDFNRPHKIGARIEAEDEQLRIAQGYDHNMALPSSQSFASSGPGGTRPLGITRRSDGGVARGNPDAIAAFAPNGRRMEVFTTEPCVHFYTGNYLGSEPAGKGGVNYGRRGGFCFETQHFTDSPNKPEWPTVQLHPGQVWDTETVYWFPTPGRTS